MARSAASACAAAAASCGSAEEAVWNKGSAWLEQARYMHACMHGCVHSRPDRAEPSPAAPRRADTTRPHLAHRVCQPLLGVQHNLHQGPVLLCCLLCLPLRGQAAVHLRAGGRAAGRRGRVSRACTVSAAAAASSVFCVCCQERPAGSCCAHAAHADADGRPTDRLQAPRSRPQARTSSSMRCSSRASARAFSASHVPPRAAPSCGGAGIGRVSRAFRLPTSMCGWYRRAGGQMPSTRRPGMADQAISSTAGGPQAVDRATGPGRGGCRMRPVVAARRGRGRARAPPASRPPAAPCRPPRPAQAAILAHLQPNCGLAGAGRARASGARATAAATANLPPLTSRGGTVRMLLAKPLCASRDAETRRAREREPLARRLLTARKGCATATPRAGMVSQTRQLLAGGRSPRPLAEGRRALRTAWRRMSPLWPAGQPRPCMATPAPPWLRRSAAGALHAAAAPSLQG